MIKEIMPLNASGEVSIYLINSQGKHNLLLKRNAVLPNSKYLITQLLLKNLAANLTNIRIYDGATLKANNPINTYTYVDPNEARYESLFDGPSFNGNYTKLVLGPNDF